MQLKKRTSKPVPPAKICSFLFGRSGFGLIGIMVAIVATGLLVVPLTRWYISMTSGAEGLQDKLAMQAIIQDHWLTLNDEGFDELSAAIATKGSTWTENVGEGGRYTITTSFGEPGKYVNAACTDGTPGTDERECRKVSVQIKDNVTGQTQALNLTKVASQTDKRLKDLEATAAGLGTRMTAAENKFGQYYTAAQVNSKFNSYYTAAQVNAKIEESGGSGTPDFSKGQTARCQVGSFGNDYHTHGASCSFVVPKNGWFYGNGYAGISCAKSYGCGGWGDETDESWQSGGNVTWNGYGFPAGAAHVKKGDVFRTSGALYHGYGNSGPFWVTLGTFYLDR